MRANRVRIIGGGWRGRFLSFPDIEGLRPSPDRVRETLFNWLGQTLHGRACLDLFAGSGALGLEAASRGADPVVLVERNRAAVSALTDNVKRLGATQVSVVHGDALDFARRDVRFYDVVFLDPPFAEGLLPAILPLVIARLAPGARVYVESAASLEPERPWQVLRRGKAGTVHYQLLALEVP